MYLSFFLPHLINLDLLSVGVTVAGIGVLGFAIYFTDTKSVTTRSFLFFAIITIFWGIANYLNYKFYNATIVLWILRAEIFLAVWHAYALFQLVYVFPNTKQVFSKWYEFGLLPIVGLISLVTLTPLAFIRVSYLAPVGKVSTVDKGPGMLLFIGIVLYLFIAAFYILVRKINRSNGIESRQLKAMFYGLLLTFFLICAFNFLLPAIFNDVGLAPLGALFIIPFIVATFYAINAYHLFNVKVVAVGVLVFLLSVGLFVEIVFATTLELIVLRSGIFVLVLTAGILLLRSVLKEVQLRETIEVQEKDLELANSRQENLLHFISHEVKGYLTRSAAAFASIGEGDYGAISEDLKKMSNDALQETRKGVETVMEILDAGDLKKGTLTFAQEPFDMRTAIEAAMTEAKVGADVQHLSISFKADDGQSYEVIGDQSQIRKHVIGNLLQNAIHYTPQGSIDVSLSRRDGFVVFAVKDTGVGLSDEDKTRLFTEGGRGKDSVKINVHSTGYGLFIAKNIVSAHGGKIWAQSEGPNKGSTFFVELPAVVEKK